MHGRVAVEVLVIRPWAALWRSGRHRSTAEPGTQPAVQAGLNEIVTLAGLERVADGPLVEAAQLALRAMDQAGSVDAQRVLFAFHWELCEVVVKRDAAWLLRIADELAGQAAAQREPPWTA